jgi:hypothetical protein
MGRGGAGARGKRHSQIARRRRVERDGREIDAVGLAAAHIGESRLDLELGWSRDPDLGPYPGDRPPRTGDRDECPGRGGDRVAPRWRCRRGCGAGDRSRFRLRGEEFEGCAHRSRGTQRHGAGFHPGAGARPTHELGAGGRDSGQRCRGIVFELSRADGATVDPGRSAGNCPGSGAVPLTERRIASCSVAWTPLSGAEKLTCCETTIALPFESTAILA